MTSKPSETSPMTMELAQMRVAIPLDCIQCGYDLNGLDASKDCPECSEPVRLSIIKAVDPVAKRMGQFKNPSHVGNVIFFAVACCVLAGLVAITASFIFPPQFIPLPVRPTYSDSLFYPLVSGICAFIGFIFMMLLLRQSMDEELRACRQGIILVSIGLFCWMLCMVIFSGLVRDIHHQSPQTPMLYDTVLPTMSAAFVFIGLRKIIPLLGKRSRAFRRAQENRQRMNDMLGALGVVIVGRWIMAGSDKETVLYTFGGIIEVMSFALIVVGLGYLLWNTYWIRNSLIFPPPLLQELLEPL